MKIGFAVLTHDDYYDALAQQLTHQAIQTLTDAGIELVVSDSPLTSQHDAVQSSVSFLGQDVDGVILFLSSWMECPVPMTLIQELGHLPLMMWGVPMVMIDGIRQSTGSYVSFAMFQGVLDRLDQRCIRLLGAPDDPETVRQAVLFCRVSAAAKKMKRSRIGLVGYSAMSIYPGTFDHLLLRRKIGPEIVHIDSYSVIRRAENLDEQSVENQINWLRSRSRIDDRVPDSAISRAAAVTVALQQLTQELDLDGINVKCQPEFSKEFGSVACVPVSSLADMGVVSSCEGDIPCSVSMLLLHFLSGQTTSYGDSINHVDNVLTLSACGFMPYSFADEKDRLICPFMPHPGFKGIQNSFVARSGKMTILRITEGVGSYKLLLMTGKARTDSQLRQGIMPSVDVDIDGSMLEVVKRYNGQHYAFGYGDWSEAVDMYGRITGIEVEQMAEKQ